MLKSGADAEFQIKAIQLNPRTGNPSGAETEMFWSIRFIEYNYC